MISPLAGKIGRGRTALITGASAGIGRALAETFARQGFDLVITARRAERLVQLSSDLKKAYGIEVRAMPADLARAEAPSNIVGALIRDGVSIDVLVNNAGYSLGAHFHDASWEAHRDFLQVLVTAPIEFMHLLLPGMRARSYGRILNVASVAGLIPGAASGTLYGGAKAMLISASHGVHAEMRGTGIHVTALCPGLTTSEFHDVNGTRPKLAKLPKFVWQTASFVADEGYAAVMKNERTRIPGNLYKALVGLSRALPQGLAERIAERAGTARR